MNDKLRKKIEALAPTHNKSEIARELKVNINTVSWYCHKYEITCARSRSIKAANDADILKKIEVLAPTHNAKMIADELGIKLHAIHRLCRDSGIKPLNKTERVIYLTREIKAKEIKRAYKQTQAKIDADTKAMAKLEAKITKLRNQCVAYCNRYNYADEADDFAQWACEAVLNGRSEVKIKILFVEYLRETKGRLDKGLPSNYIQANKLAHNHSRVRVSGTEAQPDDGFIDLTVPAEQETLELDIFSDLKFRNKFMRAYMVLMHKYGFTLQEVGEVFGVSPSRISREINEEKRLLNSRGNK